MALKNKIIKEKEERIFLLVAHEEAIRVITDRIAKGNELLKTEIKTQDDLDSQKSIVSIWNNYNRELLKKLFSNQMISLEYMNAYGSEGIIDVYSSGYFTKQVEQHKSYIRIKLVVLESIIDRVELYDIAENTSLPQSVMDKSNPTLKNEKVFIVHGHNEELKLSVARTLEKLGLEPVILHEQPNGGKTIIEKLEFNSDVGFVVVLLTPDDEGKAKTEGRLKDRARQNVLVELGYFIGKLGRKKVLPIYIEGVEVPSDFNGVLYTLFDKAGHWRFDLVRELKNTGYLVDANALLG